MEGGEFGEGNQNCIDCHLKHSKGKGGAAIEGRKQAETVRKGIGVNGECFGEGQKSENSQQGY